METVARGPKEAARTSKHLAICTILLSNAAGSRERCISIHSGLWLSTAASSAPSSFDMTRHLLGRCNLPDGATVLLLRRSS